MGISLTEAGLSVGLARPKKNADSGANPGLGDQHDSFQFDSDLIVLDGPDRHSEMLLPAINQLLDSCGCRLSELRGIAFDAGPGGFTRVRVACALSQGLALGAGLRLAPINSLETIALAVGGEGESDSAVSIAVCMDARMGECYVGRFQVDQKGVQSEGPVELVAGDRLGEWLTRRNAPLNHQMMIAGDGLGRYPETSVPELARVVGLPDGVALCHALLTLAWQTTCWLAPDQTAPHYVRNKVALNVREQAARRHSPKRSGT